MKGVSRSSAEPAFDGRPASSPYRAMAARTTAVAAMSRLYHLEPAARARLIGQLETMLAARSDIEFALVFGSFLDQEAFRDIDLAIWTTVSADRRADVELATSLSDQLGMPVDVRRVNEAPEPFLFHVLRGRQILVRDEQHLADVMERTARAYHDRAPLLRRATREAFAP